MTTKTTVIHHSADFDGIFCREIARKFLPDAKLIGWDFADKPLEIPSGPIYIMDLPVDRVFGFDYKVVGNERGPQHPPGLVWIDHHKSSIESHPTDIPGYRIDGVAACRLAWQWFTAWTRYNEQNGGNSKLIGGLSNTSDLDWFSSKYPFPTKQDYIDLKVVEPLAVRLAGLYDIWDKRDPRAELFQHGLRSCPLTRGVWDNLLGTSDYLDDPVELLLERGEAVQYAKTAENESVIKNIGFTIMWEGLIFLACNHAIYNSHLFTAGLTQDHDACFGFKWTGKNWSVSLYHAPGKEHHDLSKIAVRHGGGGHRGACGFITDTLPFLFDQKR